MSFSALLLTAVLVPVAALGGAVVSAPADHGRALHSIETHRDLDARHGQPRPSSHQPDYTLLEPSHHRYAGTDDGRGTDQRLDPKRLTLLCGRVV
jgi:hypothetical protein